MSLNQSKNYKMPQDMNADQDSDIEEVSTTGSTAQTGETFDPVLE